MIGTITSFFATRTIFNRKRTAWAVVTCIIVSVTMGAFLPLPCTARTWHINPDGTGDAPTIQAGIDSATSGDVIELADGTFTGPGNRDLNFFGKQIVLRSESSDPTVCIIDCQGSSAENHRGFYFDHEQGPDSIIEGITVTNGYGGWAGGAYCPVGAPTFSNCRFIANQGSEGGGICTHTSNLIIDCYFEGNSAASGGAISVCCDYGANATIMRCTFVGNTAMDYGGGFRC